MTKHQKIDSLPSLDRRSFIIGTAATGLVFGYVALPEIKDALAAPAANFEPTVWYAIGHDGKVTVTVGKADMGQHIASTMAQLVAEELEASWKDMAIALASNDPKYNDPILGAAVTGGSWSTGMNFDAMCRAGAAGRITLIKAAAEMLGVPESELYAKEFACPPCEIEEEPELRPDRRRRKGQQSLDCRRAQGDQAEDTGPIHKDRAVVTATRHSGEDERDRQIRNRRLRAGHAVRQAGVAAGALWRDGEIGRR